MAADEIFFSRCLEQVVVLLFQFLENVAHFLKAGGSASNSESGAIRQRIMGRSMTQINADKRSLCLFYPR
jgi:hypothetical protein